MNVIGLVPGQGEESSAEEIGRDDEASGLEAAFTWNGGFKVKPPYAKTLNNFRGSLMIRQEFRFKGGRGPGEEATLRSKATPILPCLALVPSSPAIRAGAIPILVILIDN
jgi:hypothetical protein